MQGVCTLFVPLAPSISFLRNKLAYVYDLAMVNQAEPGIRLNSYRDDRPV